MASLHCINILATMSMEHSLKEAASCDILTDLDIPQFSLISDSDAGPDDTLLRGDKTYISKLTLVLTKSFCMPHNHICIYGSRLDGTFL
ncbi:hypothetical protein PAXRUDRAFT_471165 [Paxillus rubicundulus Ve08.2h10]|uniref:Uncharacterized protein n=1 Tax=Paxillus rubicundulus Ve08.2h10 TaxID=930991 RepID=A0A0D0DAH0_9AGAM|nr:hypothetical protein PAXRUDRAFT_471165 [Paxillus rubicundulus Ve08.2h10]